MPGIKPANFVISPPNALTYQASVALRIGRRQVDVMEAVDLGILDDFDQRAPGIFDEGELDRAFLLDARDDLDAGVCQLLHLGVDVLVREADVVDRAADAAGKAFWPLKNRKLVSP